MRRKVLAGLLAGLLAVQSIAVLAEEPEKTEVPLIQADTRDEEAVTEASEIIDYEETLPEPETIASEVDAEAVPGEESGFEVEAIEVAGPELTAVDGGAMTVAAEDVPIDEDHFPDEVFRGYIEENCDKNNDQVLDTLEIKGVTSLDLDNYEDSDGGILSDLKGVEFFTALEYLDCFNGGLSSLNVSENTALKYLDCSNNDLDSLDVSENGNLETLYCSNNNLSELKLSANEALTELNCSGNKLTKLDVSENTALIDLYCDQNELSKLNVSGDSALEDLVCFENKLESFEGNGLSDLTALQRLECHNNKLNSLDVSGKTDLTNLTCFNNNLSSLDVSTNTALEDLSCDGNNLGSLDVSTNTALEDLSCARNNLSSLDVSENVALYSLSCEDNNLSSLDLSNNTALEDLFCAGNNLSSLDVSENVALHSLSCEDNNLSSLDLSSNTSLTEFSGIDQSIEVDLKSDDGTICLDLATLVGDPARVKSVSAGSISDGIWTFAQEDLSNPQTGKELYYEYDTRCPKDSYLLVVKLTCHVTAEESGGTPLPTEDVPIDETHFPDEIFRSLIQEKYDSDKDNVLSAEEIAAVTSMYAQSTSVELINDLTGVEYFTELRFLSCFREGLSELDLSKNTKLEELDCSENFYLTSLDLSKNTELTKLNCNYNQMPFLDLSNNKKLENLDCWDNCLTSLDLSENTELTELDCGSNQMPFLDLSNNKKLKKLNCRDNCLKSLDLSENTELLQLDCSCNQLAYLDLSKNRALTTFDGTDQSREVDLVLDGSSLLYSLDLKELVGGKTERVTVSEGKLSDGVLEFTEDDFLELEELSYTYKVDDSGENYLNVTLSFHIVVENAISDVTQLSVFNGEEEYPVIEWLYEDYENEKVYSRATGVTLPQGMSYDPDTNTLTLNNCNIRENQGIYGIYYDGEREFNVKLLGRNTYSYEVSGGLVSSSFIRANGNVNISGNGTLVLGKNAGSGIFCEEKRDSDGNVTVEGNLTIDGVTIESEGCQIAMASSALTISDARISQNNVNKYTQWEKMGGYSVETDRSQYNIYAFEAGKLTVTNSVIELKNTKAAFNCDSYSFSGQNLYTGTGKAEKKTDKFERTQVWIHYYEKAVRYAANDYGDYLLITTQNLDDSLPTGNGSGAGGNSEPTVAKIKSIKISADSNKIAKGKKVKLKATIAPANAGNQTLRWSTSNRKYATVNANGVVTTKAAGAGKTVKITASAQDGSGATAVYKIRIMKGVVKKVSLKGSKTLKAGKKTKLKATVKATKGANKKLAYSSSNVKYATVNKKGVVKALKAGKGKTVTITAKALDGSGKKAKIKIKIK